MNITLNSSKAVRIKAGWKHLTCESEVCKHSTVIVVWYPANRVHRSGMRPINSGFRFTFASLKGHCCTFRAAVVAVTNDNFNQTHVYITINLKIEMLLYNYCLQKNCEMLHTSAGFKFSQIAVPEVPHHIYKTRLLLQFSTRNIVCLYAFEL